VNVDATAAGAHAAALAMLGSGQLAICWGSLHGTHLAKVTNGVVPVLLETPFHSFLVCIVAGCKTHGVIQNCV